MAKIQEKDRRYTLLRWYVDLMFKSAYRRIEYWGKEHIPQDGAIIYGPNHSNTLMDALAILYIDQKEKVFVARADIFKHPLILKFLTFLKMLPINRKRDGMETIAKNEEINNIVVDAMRDKVPFCIMPEGTHGNTHSLIPLLKGIFRVALQANNDFGDKMPVYIVPVGIEFGHFFRFRSSLLVQIGAPINVTQFVQAHSHLTVPEQINALRIDLSNRLKELMLHVPNDANNQAMFELAQISGTERTNKKSLKERFMKAKVAIHRVASMIKSSPQEAQSLLNMADDFSRKRDALGIGMESIVKPHLGWAIFGKLIVLLVGLPLFVLSALATSPVTLLSIFLCTKFKDPAFHNTVRFLVTLALLPLTALISSVVIAILFWWVWGVVCFILFMPFFLFLHEYIRWLRLFVSDIKYLTHRDLYKQYIQIKNFK